MKSVTGTLSDLTRVSLSFVSVYSLSLGGGILSGKNGREFLTSTAEQLTS